MTIYKISHNVFFILISFLFFFSCSQETVKVEETPKIENMLKSVSFFHDSIPVASSNLMASLEKVNMAIDSIGYPDAGYQVWEVNSEDSLGFRIVVEGSWPDQKTYDAIHDHELYKNAMESESSKLKGLKRTNYYRFSKSK